MYIEGIVEGVGDNTLDVTTERGRFEVVAKRQKEVGAAVILRVTAELAIRRRG